MVKMSVCCTGGLGFDSLAGRKAQNFCEIFICKIPAGCHLDETFQDCWSIASKISHTWGKCVTCFELKLSGCYHLNNQPIRTFLRRLHILSFQPMDPGSIPNQGWVYVGCMFHPVQQVHITSNIGGKNLPSIHTYLLTYLFNKYWKMLHRITMLGIAKHIKSLT